MRRIGFTGPSGFLGTQFQKSFEGKYDLLPLSVRYTDSKVNLEGVEAIIHFAGLAHQKERQNPEKYFQANYALTKSLADQAINQSVRQFIFISTVKVFGDAPSPLSLETEPKFESPDPYGESKLKAENYLNALNSDMGINIIRIPLVYGAGVKANMLNLIKLCDSIMPLPFAKIRNKRSLLYSKNLMAFLEYSIENMSIGTFHLSDMPAISTSELVRAIRTSLNRSPNLFALPVMIQWVIKKLQPHKFDKLFGNLELNVEASFKMLNYSNPYSFEEGVDEMTTWYLKQKNESID
ncbi:MAG: NAD-dependent epimerase/dehydratase family protein [Saprospiraceae bacterium]|nr:NAD-dependent epimerase/dehydratase family protein [Saprospiraceae bacterium]